MVILALAALTAVSPSSPTGIAVQARATIRVVSAVRLKFGAADNDGAPPSRSSVVRLADGSAQSIKVIDFQ